MLRLLSERGASVLDAFLKSETLDAFRSSVVETRPVGELAVEHPKVWFPSYPYEWPAEMLCAAAGLTLDLARGLLQEGWGLKDATPYNILFEGARPIFVDVCSFERRDAADPLWLAYGQFVRTFLNPLIAHKYLRFPLDALMLASRDGISTEQIYRWTPWVNRWFGPLLTKITLPVLAASWAEDRPMRNGQQPAKHGEAVWVLERLLEGLRHKLEAVRPTVTPESHWTGYMQTFTYSAAQFEFKSKLVTDALIGIHPRRTLDVGCNTGYFSKMAASAGSRVVAIDRDPAVLGHLWKDASQEKFDIQPLVADFARPTPATGWRNAECSSFLDRAEGAFDLVLLLGTLHHLTVTDRVPISEVLGQAARVASHAVVEYVDPADPMFRMLARSNEHLYLDYTAEAFEQACLREFTIVRSAAVPESHRKLYVLRRRVL